MNIAFYLGKRCFGLMMRRAVGFVLGDDVGAVTSPCCIKTLAVEAR